MVTYDSLVWSVTDKMPEGDSETKSDACRFILDKLHYEYEFDVFAEIPSADVVEASGRVKSLYKRWLKHKNFQLRGYPDEKLRGFCDTLEETLTELDKIEETA